MTDTCGCCSEELGATEMRDLLLESVKALTADLHRYQGLLKEAQGERDAARESLDFMRNRWSMFGGRGCALCVYVDGKYVRACKLHEYLSAVSDHVDELQHERDAARAEAEKMRATYDAVVEWRGWRGTHAEGLFAARLASAVEASMPLDITIDTATTKRGSHGG